jgi:hypothetical protein
MLEDMKKTGCFAILQTRKKYGMQLKIVALSRTPVDMLHFSMSSSMETRKEKLWCGMFRWQWPFYNCIREVCNNKGKSWHYRTPADISHFSIHFPCLPAWKLEMEKKGMVNCDGICV